MILKNIHILSLLFGIVILTNIFQILHINIFLLGDILSILSLILIPGILILLILQIKMKSFWAILSFSVGLSLSFIMFGGLLINQALPLIGILQPLAWKFVIISFDIFFFVLFITAYLRSKNFKYSIPQVKINFLDFNFFFIPILFPILAVLGAFSLNNNGTNLFNMILLGGICIYVLAITILYNKISKSILPSSLYFIGLSLLLMTSLRSWFTAGNDNMTEYFVFQLTKSHFIWNMNFYVDPYNACLSITILPTILSDFLRFNDMYIYKVVFQAIFALCPVILYLYVKKYFSQIMAFLAAMYFIAFPSFYSDMPFLNRQEIGFLFFALLLYVTFSTSISKKMSYVFYIIFGFSLIVSHYTSAYITLIIFPFTYILTKMYSFTKIQNYLSIITNKLYINPKNYFTKHTYLSFFKILIILAFAVYWNPIFTKTSGNLGPILDNTLTNLITPNQTDTKSGDLADSIFFAHTPNPTTLLNQYITKQKVLASNDNFGSLYNQNSYKNYPTKYLNEPVTPLTQIGKFLTSLHISVFDMQALARKLSAQQLQIFLLVGIIGLVFYKIKTAIDREFLFLSFGTLTLVVLFLILPEISAAYGVSRLFQQGLFFFAPFIVLGTLFLFNFIRYSIRICLASILLILFFIIPVGFFSTITGDYNPQMNVNNDGILYNGYYVHKTDVLSAYWLKNNIKKNSLIQSDTPGRYKLIAFDGFSSTLDEIFPPIIRKKAYVYLTNTNNPNRRVIVALESYIYNFSSPVQFLNQNKNLIYNNGSNEIFK
jgi:uncharacterized membrane protein